MDINQILSLLDILTPDTGDSDRRVRLVLEAMINVLAQSASRADASALQTRLSTLLRIPSSIMGWEKVVALALDGYLPAFYDGSSLAIAPSGSSLVELVADSQSRWSTLAVDKHSVDICLFLSREAWTDLTATVVTGLTYSQSAQRPAVRDWFRSGGWQSQSILHTVSLLRALFDTCLPLSPFEDQDQDLLAILCDRVLEGMLASSDQEFLQHCKFCVEAITALYSSVKAHASTFLQGKIKNLAKHFNSTVFSIAIGLGARSNLGNSATEASLKWAVDVLSLETSASAEVHMSLSEIRRAMAIAEPKAHYAESVVTVAIQNHLADAQVLEFARVTVEHAQFKVRRPF